MLAIIPTEDTQAQTSMDPNISPKMSSSPLILAHTSTSERGVYCLRVFALAKTIGPARATRAEGENRIIELALTRRAGLWKGKYTDF